MSSRPKYNAASKSTISFYFIYVLISLSLSRFRTAQHAQRQKYDRISTKPTGLSEKQRKTTRPPKQWTDQATNPQRVYPLIHHHHHHYLSLNHEGRWGTTDDFATSFIHFPCSPLPSGTWRTPGLSIPWCCLPTSFFVCFVFFPLSLCLARWFWPSIHPLTQ